MLDPHSLSFMRCLLLSTLIYVWGGPKEQHQATGKDGPAVPAARDLAEELSLMAPDEGRLLLQIFDTVTGPSWMAFFFVMVLPCQANGLFFVVP